MKKPKDAQSFCEFNFFEKFKAFKGAMKDFGPYEEIRGKRYIIVTACTVPKIVGYLTKDLSCTIGAMKIYIKKMSGRLVGKIVYSDTLFKFNTNKKDKLMKQAFNLGKVL